MPIMPVWRDASPRADADGTYPSSSIAARMASRAASLTNPFLFTTRDTVVFENPERLATSFTVGKRSLTVPPLDGSTPPWKRDHIEAISRPK
jgi:hypothetical protein